VTLWAFCVCVCTSVSNEQRNQGLLCLISRKPLLDLRNTHTHTHTHTHRVCFTLPWLCFIRLLRNWICKPYRAGEPVVPSQPAVHLLICIVPTRQAISADSSLCTLNQNFPEGRLDRRCASSRRSDLNLRLGFVSFGLRQLMSWCWCWGFLSRMYARSHDGALWECRRW